MYNFKKYATRAIAVFVVIVTLLIIVMLDRETVECTATRATSSNPPIEDLRDKCETNIRENKSKYRSLEAQQTILNKENNIYRAVLEVIGTGEESDPPPETTPEMNTEPQAVQPKTSYLGEYNLSRYYRPTKNQRSYHHGNYNKEFYVNCQGSCAHTANGYALKSSDVGKVLACPPNIPLGTTLKLVYSRGGQKTATCHDRGGAIKNRRLDMWAGKGQQGYDNIFTRDPTPTPSGVVKVYKIEKARSKIEG